MVTLLTKQWQTNVGQVCISGKFTANLLSSAIYTIQVAGVIGLHGRLLRKGPWTATGLGTS